VTPTDQVGTTDDRRAVVLRFIRAFEAGDMDALAVLLADDFVGHVTTADAGVRAVGRDGYLDSVRAMDVPTANLELDIPNVVEVGADQVLVMVVVRAHRGDNTLHNFSGQLATVSDGRLHELWMVEALPAESDAFWS
jgi:ketosteroid isomerase-like protein